MKHFPPMKHFPEMKHFPPMKHFPEIGYFPEMLKSNAKTGLLFLNKKRRSFFVAKTVFAYFYAFHLRQYSTK